MSAKFGVISIWAKDVPGTARFYREVLGLGQFPHQGERAAFDVHGVYLLILKGRSVPAEAMVPERFPLFALSVEDLESVYNKVYTSFIAMVDGDDTGVSQYPPEAGQPRWTDPTSLETFGLIVDRVRSLPVLLIVTFRPEFEPPWIGRSYVTALTLNRLAQRDIEAIIDRVVGDKIVPASVRRDIIERTDGIPLFIEEMTKAVLEAKSEEEAQRTVSTVPSTALAVPASLHASLMARLDRLGPGKEIAQIGAVIGREFSHALLSALVRKPEAELQSALDRLTATGLLFRQGMSPQADTLPNLRPRSGEDLYAL